MLDTFLVAEQAVEANGEGAPLDLGDAAGQKFLLTLNITRILEQQALDVQIWASSDGADWRAKPALAFPQKFYAGTHQLVLDLGPKEQQGELPQALARFLRAKWTVNRWGRGELKARFTFSVALQQLAGRAAA